MVEKVCTKWCDGCIYFNPLEKACGRKRQDCIGCVYGEHGVCMRDDGEDESPSYMDLVREGIF